ncbi:MAG TPA: AI-2E family transporter [Acidobacteriaceae bacterium]|nr:AI-2E family transporter [Acidobacteriaceae bacterium]
MQARPAPPARQRGGFLASEPLLLVGLVILTLYFARDLLAPMAFALVLNFLLSPAVELLERWRVRRSVSVVLIILIFFSGLGVTAWVVARQLVHVAELLPDYRENIQTKLDSLHTPIGGAAGNAISTLEEMTRQLSSHTNATIAPPVEPETTTPTVRHRRYRQPAPEAPLPNPNATPQQPTPVQVVEPPVSVGRYLQEIFSPILRPLAACGIVMVFTVYMLMNHEDLRNRMLLLAGMGRLSLMTRALGEAAERISTYLVWQFVTNVLFGLIFGLGLSLIGVPDATLWGALAAILRYIPYVGTAAAGLLPLIFAVAIFPHWRQVFEIVGLYGALEFATSNFFEPWLYGSRTGISALALLASAIFWTLLWGWSGLVLATPLTVCLIVLGRHVPQLRFLHVLLGEDAELAPEAKFYERMLAMDQNEAHSIADRFLDKRPLIDFYDTVLLPALGLVEQDRHRGSFDETRGNYLLLSATELVAELSEYKAESVIAASAAHPEPPELPLKPAPVICIPAGDQADEVTAMVLAQLLEQSCHKTLLLPTASVTPEILERLGQDPGTILCISALPPFVFTQTRTLCQRIREQLPENRILIGLWQSAQSPDLMRERFGSARPDRVVTRLGDAMAQIEQWQQGCAPAAPPAVVAQPLTAE